MSFAPLPPIVQLFLLLDFVVVLCALLLAITWWQNRFAGTLGLWSGAYATAAAALFLLALRDRLPYAASATAGGALLMLCFALRWSAIRVLRGVRPRPVPALLPAATWIALTALPSVMEGNSLRTALLAILAGSGVLVVMSEVARLQCRSRARLALAVLMAVHAAFYLARAELLLPRPWGFDLGSDALLLLYEATAVEAMLFALTDSVLLTRLVRAMGDARL